MTIDTAVTMRSVWCQRCRDLTPHVYGDLQEGTTTFHVDQCLECGLWSG
jgi:ferredoxin-like protein FixX